MSFSIPFAAPATSLAYHYDPAGSLKQSAGGAVCVDGDPIGEWQDLSSNARHVVQTTAGAKPTFRASLAALGGRPGVEFGGDDYLSVALGASMFGNLNAYTFYATLFTTTTNIGTMVGEGNTGNANPFIYPRINSGIAEGVGGQHRDDVPVSNNMSSADVNINNGIRHTFVWRRVASNDMRLLLDGVEVATGANTVGTTTTNVLAIGVNLRTTLTNYLTGTLGVCVGYSADNLSTTFSGRTITQMLDDYYRRTTRRRRRG